MDETGIPVKSDGKIDPGSVTGRRDWTIGLLLGVGALALYGLTLAPGLLFGDSAEFQMAAWRFGLAHPTGYPLYLLLGGLWQRLLTLGGVDPALALNSFSALTGALTVSLLYGLVLRWIPPGQALRRPAGVVAAGLLAVNPTFWSQSLVAEVYTLHTVLLLVVWLLASPPQSKPWSQARFLALAVGTGLALGHHRTALFLLPGLLLLLWLQREIWRSTLTRLSGWLAVGTALLGPQLLYLYIPLRGTPQATPWYFISLGTRQLALYDGSWTGFWTFISGSGFSGSLRSGGEAIRQLGPALTLWQQHFTWPGLLFVLLGAILLIRRGRWSILALTVPFVLGLQLFNLFYGIGDIYVFYTPLYLVGALYAGFGLQSMGGAMARGLPKQGPLPWLITTGLVLALPGWLLLSFYPQVDRSQDRAATTMWQAILDAPPPAHAVLVSNDRDEMVPLLYLQAVEGVRPDLVALFPLITPGPEFAQIGATIQTALQSGQPVYLIKPMPGLDVSFDLKAAPAPLVQVGPWIWQPTGEPPPSLAYGPLTWLGYQIQRDGQEVEIQIFWRVERPVGGEYTTSVQILDQEGEKISQDDRPAGFPFLPTSLWSTGGIYRDRHRLSLPPGGEPAHVLTTLYTGPNFELLAPPLILPWSEPVPTR